MVVPHADERYHAARPTIAIPRSQVIDLDGYFGLHPALRALKPFWESRSLAVVHAVGCPHGLRSHVAAQDYLETAEPAGEGGTGWVNRYCDSNERPGSTPRRAVACGSRLPRILAGCAPAHALGEVPKSVPGYPNGRLGRSLAQIAALIKAEEGVEIAVAGGDGWDTHVHQGGVEGRLAHRLRELGDGLAAFAADLGSRMSDVVIMTMSEFGRTIAENTNGGTDHGSATAMLVMGGAVDGGQVLGVWPGLHDESNQLAVTTDFRVVFAEALASHLGAAELRSVFPAHPISSRAFPGIIRV
jgi:uncharacterized protein (DUF1501 family)